MYRCLGAAIVVLLAGCAGRPHASGDAKTHATRASGRTAAEVLGWQWNELPAAPIRERSGAAAVWTGSEMLVWGGHSGDDGEILHRDGAAYDPRAKTWRVLPEAPISARTAHSWVWTGSELVIWGGYERLGSDDRRAVGDGAAFDPYESSWRRVAPSPLRARSGAQAIWTGTKMIVVGGVPAAPSRAGGALTDGAVYDPETDAWRVLPAIPSAPDHPIQRLVFAWAGDRLLAWAMWARDEHMPGGEVRGWTGIDLWSHAGREGRWEPVEQPDNALPGIGRTFWTGHDLVLAAPRPYRGRASGPFPHRLHGARYDPATNTLTEIAHGPVDDALGPAYWAGRALIRFSQSSHGVVRPGDGAVWDETTGAWSDLPRAPWSSSYASVIVFGGDQILFWGGMFEPVEQPHDGAGRRGLPGLRFGAPAGT